MTACDIAILNLLHQGDRPPAPDHLDHERLMVDWCARYGVRFACRERMRAADVAIQAEERLCPPSP